MTYIIIRGPAGVGKSKLAKNLVIWFRRRKIKIKSFNPGSLRRRYNLSFSLEDKLKLDNILIQKTKKLINEGYVIIFDEVYYYPKQITNFNKKLGRPIIISLKASLKKCLERNNYRRSKRKLLDKNVIEVYKLDKSFKKGYVINTENKSKNEVLKQTIKLLKSKL